MGKNEKGIPGMHRTQYLHPACKNASHALRGKGGGIRGVPTGPSTPDREELDGSPSSPRLVLTSSPHPRESMVAKLDPAAVEVDLVAQELESAPAPLIEARRR